MQFSKNYPVVAAMLSAAIMMPFALAMYFAFEPAVVIGQGATTSENFTVTQSITGEISFEVTPDPVTMSPAIPGLTGGTAYGSTSVRVSTNNTTGYTLDIAFEDTQAMQQDGGSANIPNLDTTTGDYDLASIGTGDAAFAFTASSSDAVDTLLTDGTSCGAAGSPSVDSCFVMPSDATNAFTMVDSSSETLSEGQLTDIGFIVKVGANPTPTLPVDTYTATATLTATENS